MKKLIYLFILSFVITSCSSDDEIIQEEFEFVADYSTQVNVGGVVGITERMFNAGEIYKGIDEGKETITIRIAEHTELNDNCPNSWCYQEFLEVPQEFLKQVE